MKLLVSKLQYPAIVAGPILWLLFTARYTRLADPLLTPLGRLLLWSVPVAVVLAAWTNEYHHLVWTRLDVDASGPYPLTHVEYGWFVHVIRIWSYLACGAASLLLLTALLRAPREQRASLANAMFLPVFPLAVNQIYMMGNTTGLRVDLTPVGFALAGVVISVGLFRHGLLDVVPLARDTVLDALPDPVFVLDSHGRTLDANPAARWLAEREPGIVSRLDAHDTLGDVEVGGRFYELSRSHLAGLASTKAIRLHDVTERRAIEVELREAQRRLRESHAHLEKQASTDALTGLANRRAFFDRLRHETVRAERIGRSFALVMMDLDGFKALNDHFGHQAGDVALEAVGGILARTRREHDLAARLGGEEFALLLPETDLKGASALAERVRVAVGQPIVTADQPLELSMSLGVAVHRRGLSERELVSEADAALYRAKAEGRNRVVAAQSAMGSG